MITTLPIAYARSLLKILPPDCDRDAIIESAGLTPERLQSDQDISSAHYSQLFIAIVHYLQPLLHGDEAEGLLKYSSYRLILHSMVQSSNLLDALERLDAFTRRLVKNHSCPVRLQADAVQWQFHFPPADEQPEWSLQIYSMKQLNSLPGLFGHSINMWIWHRIASWLIGAFIELERASFTDPRPRHHQRYRNLFETSIYFSQTKCALIFPRRYLDYPVVQTTASADQLMATFPAQLFEVSQLQDSVTAQVRNIMGADLSQSFPGIDKIAARMCISVSTLHRHLLNENSSYQKIKDECRERAAQDYLRQKDYPIKAIAEQLGFSDSSTFHRAFRRWTGTTPRQFRDSCH